MNAPVSDLFPVALDVRYDRITRVAACVWAVFSVLMPRLPLL
jgi:hypothetical protein